MSTLEDEIARSNQEIEQKSQESKELFQYLQISEGENAYMEYIFWGNGYYGYGISYGHCRTAY